MEIRTALPVKPLADWNDEIGPVLWWRFPIQEPPWVGTPLDSDWPIEDDGDEVPYYTHWMPIPLPINPDDPDDTVTLLPRDNEALQTMLLLVEDWEIPEADIAALSDAEYQQVHDWASASILSANDHDDIKVPKRPAFLKPYDEKLNPAGRPRDYALSAASAGRFVRADQAHRDAASGQAAERPAAGAGPAGVAPSYDGPSE
jgi:hypothetical protein